jgi:hypothetical protein
MINDTGLGIYEIAGILTQDQLNTIAKDSFIDEKILKPVATAGDDTAGDAIEFTNDISDDDIDNI